MEITGDVQLSNVRQRGAAVEVRLWNHRPEPLEVVLAGVPRTLGGAKIETYTVD